MRAELHKPVFNSLTFEAILELRDVAFLPLLKEVRPNLRPETDEIIVSELDAAIAELSNTI